MVKINGKVVISLLESCFGHVMPRDVMLMWERAGHTSIHGMPSPNEVELLVSAFVMLTEGDKNSWCTSFSWDKIVDRVEQFPRAKGLRIRDEADEWLIFLTDTGLVHQQVKDGIKEICLTQTLVEKAVKAAIAMLPPKRNQT